MDRARKNAVLILVFALIVYGISLKLRSSSCPEDSRGIEIPGRIGEWTGEDLSAGPDEPRTAPGTKSAVWRAYHSRTDTVVLYAVYYRDVDSEEAVNVPGVSYPEQGWTVTENQVVDVGTGRDRARINRLVMEKPMRRELVYNWWITGGKVIPGNGVNRLYQVARVALGRHASTVWVRLSLASGQDPGRDERRLSLFAGELIRLMTAGAAQD